MKCQQELETMFPGHSRIDKIGNRNVSFNNSYVNAIKNRIAKKNDVDKSEIEYIPAPREWMQRIDNSAICQHKENGQMYLEYFYLNKNKCSYVYKWEDGTELTKDELTKAKNLFVKTSPSKKQNDAGLDNEEQIKVNIVKMENIISVNAFGQSIDKNVNIEMA
jgi:hypothetical protein